MPRIFLKTSTVTAGALLFMLHINARGQYTHCGEYERRWLRIIPLYECSFYIRDDRNTLSTLLYQNSSPTINDLAAHITDTINQISYRLQITPLLSLKRYAAERKALSATFQRAGFEVNNQWKLVIHSRHQSDVDLYIKSLLGKDEEHPGEFYATRSRGDRFILEVSNGKSGQLTYIPSQRNLREKKVIFKSAELLKGIILTYISEKQCSEELRDDLPGSLLKKLLPIDDP